MYKQAPRGIGAEIDEVRSTGNRLVLKEVLLNRGDRFYLEVVVDGARRWPKPLGWWTGNSPQVRAEGRIKGVSRLAEKASERGLAARAEVLLTLASVLAYVLNPNPGSPLFWPSWGSCYALILLSFAVAAAGLKRTLTDAYVGWTRARPRGLRLAFARRHWPRRQA